MQHFSQIVPRVFTSVLFITLCVCVCRCDIPVVIMGETGCGKTRLIRFMCDLAAQGKGKENMLILKVSTVYFNNSLGT